MITKTIACRLSIGEWNAFKGVCEKHNLRVQELLHSIIIDALLDEGYDALRPNEPPRRKDGAEASEGNGAAATGDNYWNYVPRAGKEVDV